MCTYVHAHACREFRSQSHNASQGEILKRGKTMSSLVNRGRAGAYMDWPGVIYR